MSSSDQCEIKFIWPSTEPKSVIVTGTFDNWARSLPLSRTSTGFEVKARVPWGEKVKYKFIVDGEWRLLDRQRTEVDYGGYVNNVVAIPQKPISAESSVVPTPQVHDDIHRAAAAPSKLEIDAPVENGTAKPVNDGDVKVQADNHSGVINGTRSLSHLANTPVACNGTSALAYVASGLGAASQTVTGVDPVNDQQMATPSPKAEEAYKIPEGRGLLSNAPNLESEFLESLEASSQSSTSPVAPIVPIMIIPVNASENNTIPRETYPPYIDSQVQIPIVTAKAYVSSADVGNAETAPPTIIVSEAAPTADSVEEQPPSVASESVVPVTTTVVKQDETPPPVIVEDEVLVEVKPAEELTPAIVPAEVTAVAPVEESPIQQVEQKADTLEPVEALPADEIHSIPSEAAVSVKTETSSESAIVAAPAKVEVVGEPITEGMTSPPPSTQSTSAPEPTTPTKSRFGSTSQQSSPSGSPASSKVGSKRQKRHSLLHKLKEIFHHDKEKPEKVKK